MPSARWHRDVGAIVESPAMFPTMTGSENLRLLAAIDRIGARRVEECLALVGLSDRAGESVKNYSLGMRQRLGLAAALLKDPALLILDEPANGLDPAGIREIRSASAANSATDGRTVFVSSHQLAEVENTCDRRCHHRSRPAPTERPCRRCPRRSRPPDAARRPRRPGSGCRADSARTGVAVELDVAACLRVAMPATGAAQITRLLAEAGLYVNELRAGDGDIGRPVPRRHSARDAPASRTRRHELSTAHLVEMRRALHRRLVRWMIVVARRGLCRHGLDRLPLQQ